MAIKTGSLKKEEGYVADSILIAELIDYAVEEGPFSYFELIEKLSSKIMSYEDEADEDALIHGRSPEKYLDVIVRHSKFFKDYFESVENDEYHSVEVSIPLGKLDSDEDDDEDYSYVPEGSDEDDFWVQNMNADIEKEKEKEKKRSLEKRERLIVIVLAMVFAIVSSQKRKSLSLKKSSKTSYGYLIMLIKSIERLKLQAN